MERRISFDTTNHGERAEFLNDATILRRSSSFNGGAAWCPQPLTPRIVNLQGRDTTAIGFSVVVREVDDSLVGSLKVGLTTEAVTANLAEVQLFALPYTKWFNILELARRNLEVKEIVGIYIVSAPDTTVLVTLNDTIVSSTPWPQGRERPAPSQAYALVEVYGQAVSVELLQPF